MLPDMPPMTVADLEQVMAIEADAYAHPWTRGNFVDSLAAGHLARIALDDSGQCIGYFVAMTGVGEMHLLNLTVAAQARRRGRATAMLRALRGESRARGARVMLLEVRQGNFAARRLYERFGFVQVGLRPSYYPDASGQREDAVVMSLDLSGAADAVA